MFTFGREHEKKCAVWYVRNPAHRAMAEQVVDAVHDLLEGKTTASDAVAVICDALLHGGSGVWEQAGCWLVKTASAYPETASIWGTLAAARSARQRFRVAAHICDMPGDALRAVLPVLLNDKSTNVRSKVVNDLWAQPRPEALESLSARLANEPNADVRSTMQLAIEAIRKHGLQ